MEATSLQPLIVNVNVPLCPRACGFCDLGMHSGEAASTEGRQAYVQALLSEIDAASEDLASYEVQAVHFSGGAANHLGGPALGTLMDALSQCVTMQPGCEVSLACVPTGLSVAVFEHLQRRWKLRLEIEFGTSDALLHQGLGRWFSVGAVWDAAAMATSWRRPDFDLDILYGLQGQGTPALRASVETAFKLGATHTTLSPLRLTVGTTVAAAFAQTVGRENLSPRRAFPDEAKRRVLYAAGVERLEELGYVRYTQRHFARDGHTARRIELACQGADKMGFGAGAHSRYANVRCTNTSDIKRYLEGSADFRRIMETSGVVSNEQAAREQLARRLFAIDGVALNEAPAFNGQDELLETFEAAGWLERNRGHARLTQEGGLHWDEVRTLLLGCNETTS